ncbi:photosynthetic reaction center cytochrome c subunit [Ectothiorhodosinus mongolicus]|uniref:Photosynthetic reaction center cytochrome c subunit n=2 Tax=Ectothiorhodosinus mongolicus TaxID=233100 RepID=A0A1R3W6E0_9GAMM|nr:photosynthetic reaction center cytochrome PufC [Ectothiorhodosinus mongolicus]ULX57640.1 photosynthetic reaction center cytochrome c subunit [Ectothiorhodosinus mongolicus]SIT73241.1 photosynthetic reaction center cytochrome c subunit [Ectothiorhodosinus mongolicus]
MKTMTQKSVLIAAVAGSALLISGCEPPIGIETDQKGYRGLGLEQVQKRYLEERKRADMTIPAVQPPAASAGPRAGDIYQNVQVLGDLSIGEFNRLMNAITEWVSPEAGCNYCHVTGNFADDNIYTKVVSRRMLEMTKIINTDWNVHVADTGVTCYTCHMGEPVPQNIWFEDPGPRQAGGLAALRMGQNLASPNLASTSLPNDVFSAFFEDNPREIRVTPTTMLPEGSNPTNVMDAEWSYGLMIHMSTALGANCTTCHNTNNFPSWEHSPPQRVTAWHGIQMVRSLNVDFLNPLQPVYPDSQLGPLGDAPKANCATCHNGLQLPLDQAQMLADYPELNRVQVRGMNAAAPEAAPAYAPEPAPEGEEPSVIEPEAESEVSAATNANSAGS